MNKIFRNSITSAKTYPGADIGSDHNPLVANFGEELKKIVCAKARKYNLRQLQNEDTRHQIQPYIRKIIRKYKTNEPDNDMT